MKKKSLLFLSVCVMLLLCVALTACSLVTTNEERKASRELATVTVDLVHEYGDGVKVLGRGELTKKLTVKAAAFTEGAKSKIEAAGGTCEVV